MKAALLIIGDEILSGDTRDTNSHFAAGLLNGMGVSLVHILAAGDNEESIARALDFALANADLVISTGGLGPTKDDITKTTIAKYFDCGLKRDVAVYQALQERFAKSGMALNELNEAQAMVPEIAEAIVNPVGTAPVCWIEKNGKVLVTLPGVPSEMQYLLKEVLYDKIKERFADEVVVEKNILTAGIPESVLALKIEGAEQQMELSNTATEKYKLAYLPTLGGVRLKITGRGKDKAVLQNKINDISRQLVLQAGEYVFGEDDDTLPQVIGRMLLQKSATISTAESCTGGYLAHLITSVAGSSGYYQGSIISYAEEVKMQELGVKPGTLKEHPAVSEQTCKEMAEGCRKKFGTTYAIATTGIAGPGGEQRGEPVGTVYIGIAGAKGTVVKRSVFNRNREENIQLFSLTALDMLRRYTENS
jgi:nicotinamide-nucleotide amidase